MMKIVLALGCVATVSAQSSCDADVNGDLTVDVNDLLGLLSGFGGDGADGSDVNGDGTVDVNDLLSLLGDFGSTCEAAAECAQGDDCGGQVWNGCGSMCPPTCGVQMGVPCPEMCVAQNQCPGGQMWEPATSSCVANADCTTQWVGELPPMQPPGGGSGGMEAPACSIGEDCGGQVWNDCGSMCPLLCGQMIGMCNMMCNAAYQCPGISRCGAQHFDDVVGECVCDTDCTVGAPELPPDIAIGRPFLSAKAAPVFATALEAASDWATIM